MAEVKVKVVEAFNDRTAGKKLRKVGEVLTVSEERAKKLEGLGLVKRFQDKSGTAERPKEQKG